MLLPPSCLEIEAAGSFETLVPEQRHIPKTTILYCYIFLFAHFSYLPLECSFVITWCTKELSSNNKIVEIQVDHYCIQNLWCLELRLIHWYNVAAFIPSEFGQQSSCDVHGAVRSGCMDLPAELCSHQAVPCDVIWIIVWCKCGTSCYQNVSQ
jgi:hypothetical protein